MRATSQKLGLACESFGIAHADQHRALSDARATAQLASLLLDNHIVTDAERRELVETAHDLGINQRQIDRAHRAYFDSIVAAAQRDHVITSDEHELMERIAQALDITDATIPEVTETQRTVDLAEGARVCFTGTATIGGEAVAKDVLERLAALAGLVPVSSVTKKRSLRGNVGWGCWARHRQVR